MVSIICESCGKVENIASISNAWERASEDKLWGDHFHTGTPVFRALYRLGKYVDVCNECFEKAELVRVEIRAAGELAFDKALNLYKE